MLWGMMLHQIIVRVRVITIVQWGYMSYRYCVGVTAPWTVDAVL